MYYGNGIATVFPLGKNEDGSAVYLFYDGKGAILSPGEGYDVEKNNVVFKDPPPNGARIVFSREKAAFTSTDAVNRIVEAMHYLDTLAEDMRHSMSMHKISVDKMLDSYKKEMSDTLEHMDEMAIKKSDGAAEQTIKKIESGLEVLLAQIRSEVKKAEDAHEEASSLTDEIDERLSSLNVQLDTYVEDLGASLEKGNEIIKTINRLSNDALADIRKTKAAALSDVGSVAQKGATFLKNETEDLRAALEKRLDGAEEQLDRIESAISSLRSGAGRISRKLEV